MEEIKQYTPKDYIFEGADKTESISERTIQTVFKQRVKAAGIIKPVTTHDLRHTHTTHSLEEGSDIQAVQRNPRDFYLQRLQRPNTKRNDIDN